MNEPNHHRLLNILARMKGIGNRELEVLKDASNFTDDFRGLLDTQAAKHPSITATVAVNSLWNPVSLVNTVLLSAEAFHEFMLEKKYFYYHFFYDIEVEKEASQEGTILLRRCAHDQYSIQNSVAKCDLGKQGEMNLKHFFTMINEST